jgi:signal transduction histidine kinase
MPTPAGRDVPALVASATGAGTDVRLDVSGPLAEVEGVVGLALYRVLQECLANAAKHAPGGVVNVRIDVAPEDVSISVVDRGGAAALSGPPGVGLIGMRERVEALGGAISAGPVPGGWAVAVRLPRVLPAHPAAEARP